MSLDLARVLEVPQPSVPEVNEFLAALCRWRRLAKITFAMVFAAVIVLGLLLSDRYEARMEILVEQSQLRRADPVLSGGADAQPMLNGRSASSEETLNSEIALLRSEDVLRQVVASTLENSSTEEKADYGVIKEKIRIDLKRYIQKNTSRRPLIMPVILEI